MQLRYAGSASNANSRKSDRRDRTSVEPMPESGPGFGGPQTQKSFIEFTGKKSQNDPSATCPHLFSGDLLTVGVLTLGRLVGACPTLVRSRLPVFRLSRGVGRQVGGRVSLRVDADEAEVENEREDEGEHWGCSRPGGREEERETPDRSHWAAKHLSRVS
jgi:hypothetical protein